MGLPGWQPQNIFKSALPLEVYILPKHKYVDFSLENVTIISGGRKSIAFLCKKSS
jgi:hypothetical protein